jgi:hypothetical protein
LTYIELILNNLTNSSYQFFFILILILKYNQKVFERGKKLYLADLDFRLPLCLDLLRLLDDLFFEDSFFDLLDDFLLLFFTLPRSVDFFSLVFLDRERLRPPDSFVSSDWDEPLNTFDELPDRVWVDPDEVDDNEVSTDELCGDLDRSGDETELFESPDDLERLFFFFDFFGFLSELLVSLLSSTFRESLLLDMMIRLLTVGLLPLLAIMVKPPSDSIASARDIAAVVSSLLRFSLVSSLLDLLLALSDIRRRWRLRRVGL